MRICKTKTRIQYLICSSSVNWSKACFQLSGITLSHTPSVKKSRVRYWKRKECFSIKVARSWAYSVNKKQIEEGSMFCLEMCMKTCLFGLTSYIVGDHHVDTLFTFKCKTTFLLVSFFPIPYFVFAFVCYPIIKS